MQAATASMLELPLDRVPNFILMSDPDERMRDFFAAHGVYLSKCNRDAQPPGLYLATGQSAQGHEHIVIMHLGRIVHDPNPHSKGMVSIDGVLWPMD